MMPTKEKVVPTLAFYDNDAHVICLYDIDEAKIVLAGAIDANEHSQIITVLDIDCFVVADFELSPFDLAIARQVCLTYIGVIGLRERNYYSAGTLLAALVEV